jgi:hypothetical protein
MSEPQRLHPATLACPTCQRPWPLEATSSRPLTGRELDVLSAWWHYRSVKLAAVLIGVGQQRAKNLLASARGKGGVHSNIELVGLHLGLIRPRADLVTQHNRRREEG